MGFFDKVGGFLEGMVNSMDRQMDRTANKKDATIDELGQAMDWYSKRADQKSCARCGGAVVSNSSDYCYKCRKKMGMED